MNHFPRKLTLFVGAAALLALSACSAVPADGTDPVPTTTESGGGGVGVAPSTPAPEPTLDGTFFYLGIGTTAGGLYTLKAGTLTKVVPDTSFGFYQSAVVSPNGKQVAYVLGDSAGSTGQMRVLTLGAGTTTIGPSTISNLQLPQWTPDSAGLYVGYGSSGEYGLMHAGTGAVTPVVSASGRFALRSADNAFAIVRSGTTIRVVNGDGSGPVDAVVPAGMNWIRFQSMSTDGKHVAGILRAVGQPMGDAGRATGSNSIVNMLTGTIEAVPGGGTLLHAVYLANGNLVIRVDAGGGTKHVRLVSPAGAVLDQIVEPAAASALSLISYTPIS